MSTVFNNDKHQAEIQMLNHVLADQVTLYTKLRKYHWNIVSRSFIEMHEFLEKLYTEMADSYDQVAERIRTLGGNAAGSMQEFLDLTGISEDLGQYPGDKQMLTNLLTDYEYLIQRVSDFAKDIESGSGDSATRDFMIQIQIMLEKRAWMIRSYLQAG